MIGLGLSITQRAVLQMLGFSPASLFAASEPGVWYDPSDMSTMFQDAAGTTPVTAVEQPVGLLLDKSKGLVLGPELVTNGDFSNGTTGWVGSTTPSNITIVNGRLEISSQPPAAATAYQAINVQSGKTYFASGVGFRKIGDSSCFMTFRSGPSLADPAIGQVNTSGYNSSTDVKLSAWFTATTTGIVYLHFPVSAAQGSTVFSVDNISVRELSGNHATQTTATSRPVLKQDGNGKYYLRFDGIDDWLVTPTITPGTDKAQVFAGVRKLSDATRGVILESSGSIDTNNGALLLTAPDGASSTYAWDSKGTAIAEAIGTGFAAPITSVLTGLGDIAGDSAILRVNGTQAAQSTADQGTGNYLANQLRIGRRAGTSMPANINLYGLIVRFGANLPAGTIASTETWLNQKTGAY